MTALWTPALLGTDVAMWFDADLASTITLAADGTTVNEWRSRVNGSKATPAANGPLYSPSVYNGKPGIDLGSTSSDSHYLTVTGPDGLFPAALPVGNSPHAVACVGFGDGGEQNQVILNWGASGYRGTNTQRLFGYRNDDQGFPWFTTLGDDDHFPDRPWTNNWRFIVHEADTSGSGTVKTFTVDGSSPLVTTTGSLSTYAEVCNIGYQAISYNYFRGIAQEILVIVRILTAAERQMLEGYLAWKWQLQAQLPYSHPYRSGAPLADGSVIQAAYNPVCWNPADTNTSNASNVTFTSDKLTCFTEYNGRRHARVNAAIPPNSRAYYEMAVTAGSNYIQIGLTNSDNWVPSGKYLGEDALGMGYLNHAGLVVVNQATLATLDLFSDDVIGIAVDTVDQTVWFRNISRGGYWNGAASADPASNVGGISLSANLPGAVVPSVSTDNDGFTIVLHALASSFVATPPTGFSALDPGPAAPTSGPVSGHSYAYYL